MTERSEGMLPIVGNFTPELVDGFSEELVEWMLDDLKQRGGPEPKVVQRAIKNGAKFRRIMNAAIEAAMKVDGLAEFGEQKGGSTSLIVLCLIIGWKLAERRMSQMAGQEVM